MSEYSKTLIDKIKLAAGNYRNDKVSFYECEVIAQDDGTSYDVNNYTIKCKIISSKSISSINLDDIVNTSDNSTQNKAIDLTYQNDNPNKNLGALYLNHVRLMCGVDDGLLIIPKTGSHVTVLNSTYQLPIVIQYSDIDAIYTSYNKEYNNEVNDGINKNSILMATQSITVLSRDSVSSNNNNNMLITPTSTTIEVVNNDNQTTLTVGSTISLDTLDINSGDETRITQTPVSFSYNSGDKAMFNLNSDFRLESAGSSIINGNEKIKICNDNADLKNLLTDLVTIVKSMADSLGHLTVTSNIVPPYTSSLPNNVADFITDSNNLSTVITSIDKLLTNI